MTKLVVEYNEDGEITEWSYAVEDDYHPDEGETVVDDSEVTHRDLPGKKVDTETGNLVEDPDHDPRSALERLADLESENPVRRARVSPETMDELMALRDAGDVQGQVDILIEVLTGTHPDEYCG